jgi:hypothetical protein
MSRLLSLGLCGAILASTTWGCSGPSAVYERAQSRFDFPNSNIMPVGHVRSEVTSTSITSPEISDPVVEERAVNDALSQKGGDILIDGVYQWTSRYVWVIVPIYFNRLVVEGEAGTIEGNGSQK